MYLPPLLELTSVEPDNPGLVPELDLCRSSELLPSVTISEKSAIVENSFKKRLQQRQPIRPQLARPQPSPLLYRKMRPLRGECAKSRANAREYSLACPKLAAARSRFSHWLRQSSFSGSSRIKVASDASAQSFSAFICLPQNVLDSLECDSKSTQNRPSRGLRDRFRPSHRIHNVVGTGSQHGVDHVVRETELHRADKTPAARERMPRIVS